jgi:hypothetical protein
VIESTVDSGSSFIVTFPCTVVGSSSSSSAGSSVTSTRGSTDAANCSSSSNRNRIPTTASATRSSRSVSAAATVTAGSSTISVRRLSNQDESSATVDTSGNDSQSSANVHACSSASCECGVHGVSDGLTAVQLPLLPTVILRVSYVTLCYATSYYITSQVCKELSSRRNSSSSSCEDAAINIHGVVMLHMYTC